MRRILCGLVAAGLLAMLASPVLAEEKEKKKPAKPKDTYAGTFSFPKAIKLTDKQTEELAALKKEYSPKLEAIDKKRGEVLTADRVKEAVAARKKAADEGKKGKDLSKAYNDALKLTKDEQKKLADINKERATLMKEITTKKMALLTDEQKEALKPKPKKPKDKPKDS